MRRRWNHNIEYHPVVLDAVPPLCASALDVGCGEGLLARKLACRSERVTGVDVDEKIIAVANGTSRPPNVDFLQADVMMHPFAPGTFNFICSVATLHHLPLEPALMRLADLLAPGGVLAVIGLYRSRSVADTACAAAGLLASHVKRQFYNFEVMSAPMQEPTQTLPEIRSAANRLLPGSVLRRRLFFRYSLIWHKPDLTDQ